LLTTYTLVEIFANHISDKGLIQKYIRISSNSIARKHIIGLKMDEESE
jgi:hypothetical protein